MKTTFWHLALVPVLALSVSAQVKSPGPTEPSSTLEISGIGDHHRSWQRVTMETDETGKTISRTNAAYTELETGMNVRQADGSFVAASDEIEITREGAVARKGRHQVIFDVNCSSPVAIDMLTADGKRLQSRILGLAFFDTSTGKSVMIAEIKDSDGQLLMETKNEVIYYDAFTDFRADVRYKNTKAGLEQDIILRENPPSPADYNLNPETTVLEVLTEFFNPPVPEKKVQITDSSINEFLNFGDLQMGNGRVYVMDKETTAIPVIKQWGTVDGRTFLIEEIPFTKVEPELQALPKGTASVKPAADGIRHQVSIKRLLPAVKQARKSGGPMRLASAPLRGRGVVLDYVTMSSKTNFTFQSDTTYYVSGTVNLSGATTTFEGGTVIKYAPTNTPKLNITSPITWLGSMYRPIVMTARSDNTIGETVSGSTGNPNTNYFANPALYIDGTAAGTNAILQNLRIAFAQSAIVFNGKTGHVVSHAQFVNCANGLTATNAEFSLRNALLYSVLTNFNGSSATGRCEHLTVNTANWLNCNSAIALTLTNSLLVSVTNGGSFTSNAVSTGAASAFQTVGSGYHYLAVGSAYRDAGTTSINASLATDLRRLTTYPPLVLTNHFANSTTLSAQAQRDTDLPDLGYHYDPLDYCWTARNLTNATLTLTNGVAVGIYGSSGLTLQQGGKLVSQGAPTALNHLVRYHAVQEQEVLWGNSADPTSLMNMTGTPATSLPTVQLRFTDLSLLANTATKRYVLDTGGSNLVSTLALQDCQVRGGYLYNLLYNNVNQMTVGLTNCFLQRVDFTFTQNRFADATPFGVYMWNNLILNSTLALDAGNNGVLQWRVHDNFFDTVTLTGSGSKLTNSYNSYRATTQLPAPTTGNITVTNADYQVGALGNYYYPTNGGHLSQLLNAGSRNATNATLYHFTTTTNQVKEANSTVDIGFHYVAVDSSTGLPYDTDGDGVADYLEDRNGNGAVNSDETDWQSATDLGLRVFITEPKRSTNLP